MTEIYITIHSVAGTVLYESVQADIKGALVEAVRIGANLTNANLTNANLRSADLSYTNLRNADLTNADLSYTDLRHADLRSADLRSANLTGTDLSYTNLRNANLTGADLRNANLTGANLTDADLSYTDLRDATMNWRSHKLVAEVLIQAAGDDVQKRMLAGLVRVSRDWCWNIFMGLELPEKHWAIEVLRSKITDGDYAPGCLMGGATNTTHSTGKTKVTG